MEENCIFCKIAQGQIPAEKIYEDENIVSFLDINPFIKGHTLVIPKKHSRWIWDIPDKDYSKFTLEIKKTAEILKKAFDTDCIQQLIIGMEVPHTHVHLLPRTKNDGFSEFPKQPLSPKPTNEEIKQVAEKIKEFI